MDDFEKEFDRKIAIIQARTSSYLYWLHPPMRCIGCKGTMPTFVQTGRALFDVAGWKTKRIDNEAVAIAIGIELKRNKDSHTSMRIVGDDGTGSGVQSHQLEALAAVHRAGGIARILWNNGGRVGVLEGEQINHCYFAYGVSVQAEKMRKTFAKGSRSIPWSLFRIIDLTEHPEHVIIEEKKDPTVAEVLKQNRKKVIKQVEEAKDEEVDPETLEPDCHICGKKHCTCEEADIPF